MSVTQQSSKATGSTSKDFRVSMIRFSRLHLSACHKWLGEKLRRFSLSRRWLLAISRASGKRAEAFQQVDGPSDEFQWKVWGGRGAILVIGSVGKGLMRTNIGRERLATREPVPVSFLGFQWMTA